MIIPKEKAKEIIAAAGGIQAVRLKFSISRNSVHEWIAKGSIPAERCPDLEAMTERKFLCEDMRPDVNWAVLRSNAA